MAKKIDVKEGLTGLKEKSGGFFSEFKSFILRGNVMDMAIGVIIGSAFSGIVTALTTDFINPLIASIGGVEFGGRLHLPWTPAGDAGQYLLWGDFITAVINFLIMALVLFIMLKSVNKLLDGTKKKQEEETPAIVKSDEAVLLEEIRDLLKKNSK